MSWGGLSPGKVWPMLATTVRRVNRVAVAMATATLFASIAGTVEAAGERDCDGKPTGRHLGPTTTLRAWHNPNIAKVTDFELCFEGYVSKFAGKSDVDGDGDRDRPRAPLFVAHRIEAAKSAPESRKRPSMWFSIDELVDKGVAPIDQAYVYSAAWRAGHPDWFERRHLLGFLTGCNMDFFFSTIDRVTAAILPKIAPDSIKRADKPDPPGGAKAPPSCAELFEFFKNTRADDVKVVLKDAINRPLPNGS